MRMTYTIAHKVGWDAADRQMREAGRTVWNEEDGELAAQTLRHHFPLCQELPGIEPGRCACPRFTPELVSGA